GHAVRVVGADQRANARAVLTRGVGRVRVLPADHGGTSLCVVGWCCVPGTELRRERLRAPGWWGQCGRRASHSRAAAYRPSPPVATVAPMAAAVRMSMVSATPGCGRSLTW